MLKFYLLKFQLFALVLQHGGVEVSTVGQGLSVCSLHVLPMLAWVLSGFSSFLPQYKDCKLLGLGWVAGIGSRIQNLPAVTES